MIGRKGIECRAPDCDVGRIGGTFPGASRQSEGERGDERGGAWRLTLDAAYA